MNPKVIILTGAITLVVVAGGIMLASVQSQAAKLDKNSLAALKINQTSYDWGEIDYGGGVVTHSFALKNTGSEDLLIANIKTSCMCTQAWLETRHGNGPKFGMSQISDWKGYLSPGEEGDIKVEFDPTYHGPGATGPINRITSIQTNDPNNSYIELTLTGTVVKK